MHYHRWFRFALSLIAATSLTAVGLETSQPATVQAKSYSDRSLAKLKFHHQEIVFVDHDRPKFSHQTESLKHGSWEKFSHLDYLGRAHTANALLNKNLMPTSRRKALSWDPTGWHNRRIASGWLYNRCHLIGYQLSGQNNNPLNLITGTRELNDPDMLKYENKVAAYIRKSRHHYVRYRVTPIYRGLDLLANGVEMEGQSIGSNRVHFNVYIFNEQPGVILNYKTGYSRLSKKKAKKHLVHHYQKKRQRSHHPKRRGTIATAHHRVVGNRRSKIYHVMHGQNYHISKQNAVYFKSAAAARTAGYRPSKR
jgi:DNA-entry nuclease